MELTHLDRLRRANQLLDEQMTSIERLEERIRDCNLPEINALRGKYLMLLNYMAQKKYALGGLIASEEDMKDIQRRFDENRELGMKRRRRT